MLTITNTVWGYAGAQSVYMFKLTNTSGAFVEVMNYGATLVSVWVPDRNNMLENVILSYGTLEGYLNDTSYLGATVGRYANRIGGAAFTLDGTVYELDNNDNGNSNHGGFNGFNSKVFDYEVLDDRIRFHLKSPDGDGGFPGNLMLTVEYQWTEANELSISYHAVTDRNTPVNITNHAYFNLSAGRSNIFDHILSIQSDTIIEAAEDHIPTGTLTPANEKAFNQNKIGEKISIADGRTCGLNVCYVLDKADGNEAPACILSDPASGRSLEVFTSYPGLIVYTGDYLSGNPHQPFDGLCLECQFFPDSPNHPPFPFTILMPDAAYQHSISFKFLKS